jgi:hypothetical protein
MCSQGKLSSFRILGIPWDYVSDKLFFDFSAKIMPMGLLDKLNKVINSAFTLGPIRDPATIYTHRETPHATMLEAWTHVEVEVTRQNPTKMPTMGGTNPRAHWICI